MLQIRAKRASAKHAVRRVGTLVKKKLSELDNRKGEVSFHDDARRHNSLTTHQKLTELNWEEMLHQPYSPGLSSSD